MNTIKKFIKEWLLTFSMKSSLLSSKKLERFAFTFVSLGAVITCIVYEVVEDKLTAMETTILITPLLICAGYNLAQTEKSKINIKKEESNEGA